MKYRDPVTGNLLDVILPAGGDTLPIGTIVNYDGEDVPMNYELVDGGEILNEASTSMNDSYSCNYINGTILYDNSTGSNANVTLSDNVNNYNKLLIEYANSSLVTTASRYVTGNSVWFVLQLNILTPGENYVRNNGYSINNNIITLSNSVNYHFNAQGYFYDAGETSAVYITKVIGYK